MTSAFQSPVRARLVQSAVVFSALMLTAASVPSGTADQTGFAPDRLQRIHEVMQRYIDAGQISGAVTLVARRGHIAHLEAHGLADLESKKAMPKDAIFRLASTSKPVTAAAIMMLVEEGKVRLTDPVSRFIPEFKSMKVAMPRPGAQPAPAPAAGGRGGGSDVAFDLVSATREITIKDLLTHGSGLMSGGLGGTQAARLAPKAPTDSLADYIPKLAGVPLDFQPGTAWRYSGIAGFEVLSRVVEVASGQPFDQFLQKRVFEPLGMKDTGFWFPEDRLARRVTLYQRVDSKLSRSQTQDGLSNKVYFSGAGGLMSTVEDYLQFAQMLVNGGTLNGKRLLGPRTVELMSNGSHAGELFAANPGRGGMGFGLGVDVVQDLARSNRMTSVGSFGWDGAYGTHFWVDAKEQMVGIMFINTATPGLARDFETAVMQAIVN
ncbi:MAG: serine hydrolase domain-containing protein [Acidobacteriota bacterium]